MKEKEKLIRNILVQYNCLGDLGRSFEEMAANGWMLEEISGRTKFIFRKCNPKKIYFSVNIFPEGSEYDTHPSEANLEYNEFCKNAGWDFVCSSGPIHVFVSENADAEIIDTDPVTELKSINRLMRPQMILNAVMAAFGITTIAYNLTINMYAFLMHFVVFMGVFIWGLAIILFAFKTSGYLLWYRRAKKAASEGEKLPEGKKTSFRTNMILLSLMFLVMSVLFIWAGKKFESQECFYMIPIFSAIFLVFFVSRKFLQFSEKKKIGRDGLKVITWVVLPVLTVVLINILIISLVINGVDDTDRKTDLISDTTVFAAENSDISRFEQKKWKFGSFILNQYNYTLSEYTDNKLSAEWNCQVYETRNSSAYRRIISDVKNGKIRIFGILFDFNRSVVPEGISHDGTEVYECKNVNDVGNYYEYLIYDSDTILRCGCKSELSQEQFDVICRDIVMR